MGELDESIWKKLEEEMLADRATIAHHLAHLAALARGHEKAAALAEGHKGARHRQRGRGLCQADGQGDGEQGGRHH